MSKFDEYWKNYVNSNDTKSKQYWLEMIYFLSK